MSLCLVSFADVVFTSGGRGGAARILRFCVEETAAGAPRSECDCTAVTNALASAVSEVRSESSRTSTAGGMITDSRGKRKKRG